VHDAATRVVLYNSLRDAVRDGELPVTDALALLRDGLPGEFNDDIVASMAAFAVSLASLWSPWPARAARLAGVADVIASRAAACEPGSDRQMILARAWVRCIADAQTLAAWLQPGGAWPGLEPDHELRWSVITRLVALGGDTALIDAELQHDPMGDDLAAGARAAAPTPAAKQVALDALLRPSPMRAYELYAIGEEIWQVGQEEQCVDAVAQWFAGIGGTAGFRSGWALARVARASFPLLVASPSTLELAQTTLAGVPDERLRRELADATAMLTRVVRSHQQS